MRNNILEGTPKALKSSKIMTSFKYHGAGRVGGSQPVKPYWNKPFRYLFASYSSSANNGNMRKLGSLQ